MNKNYYWPVYQNLEKEVLELANQIHIDDSQLSVYSVKISELLIRTVVEIEAISKELYFSEGGTKPDDNNLFFDTDCLNFLEEKWKLGFKVINITSPLFYISLDQNKTFTPLKKANKRGSSSSDWQRAYQAVKHNRTKNLKLANLKHIIRALGGLFILNLYFKKLQFKLGDDAFGIKLDLSQGSSIFSFTTFQTQYNLNNVSYKDDLKYKSSLYIIYPESSSLEKMRSANKEINDEINKRIFEKIDMEGFIDSMHEIMKLPDGPNKTELINQENLRRDNRVKEIGDKIRNEVVQNLGLNLYNAQKALVYYADINLNQF